MNQPPWELRLDHVLAQFADRDHRDRLRELKRALDETDPAADPDTHRALRLEYFRLHGQRPDTKKNAS